MKSEVKAKQTIAEDGGLPSVELILREDGTLEIHSACEWGRASFVLSTMQRQSVMEFIAKNHVSTYGKSGKLNIGTVGAGAIDPKASWMNETLGCGSTLPANPPELKARVIDESRWGPSPLAQGISDYVKYQRVKKAIGLSWLNDPSFVPVRPLTDEQLKKEMEKVQQGRMTTIKPITIAVDPASPEGDYSASYSAENGYSASFFIKDRGDGVYERDEEMTNKIHPTFGKGPQGKEGSFVYPPEIGKDLIGLLKAGVTIKGPPMNLREAILQNKENLPGSPGRIPITSIKIHTDMIESKQIATNKMTYKLGGSPHDLLIADPERTINAGNPFDKDWSK